MKGVRRVFRISGVALALAATLPVLPGLAVPAHAVSCKVVRISATPGSVVRLTVPSVTVPAGGCVAFANATGLPAQVTVAGTSYTRTVPPGGTTSGPGNYPVTRTVTVTATSGLRTGTGTITARRSSPSPSRATHSPSARPTRSSSPVASPDVAPSPRKHLRDRAGHRHRRALKLPPLPPLPSNGLTATPRGSNPLVAPGLTAGAAAVDPTASAAGTTPVATVVEPAAGSGRGLPALIGAVLVVGLLAAYARVALAFGSPADRRDAPRSRQRHRA